MLSKEIAIQKYPYSKNLSTFPLNNFPRIPNLHSPIPQPTVNRHRLLPPCLSSFPFRPNPILPRKNTHTKHALQQLNLPRQSFHFPFPPLAA